MLIFIKDLGFLLCFFVLSINFCLSNNLLSHNNADPTLISVNQIEIKLVDLELLIKNSELDSAKNLGVQIVESSKVHNMIATQLHGHYQLAKIYNRENNFEKSDSLLLVSLNKCDDADLSFDMQLLLYNNAARQGEFDKAKLMLDQARQFVKDTLGVNMVRYRYTLADYINIAVKDHKKVLDLLLLAKKEAPKDIEYMLLFNINYQLGALYIDIAVYDQAILVGEENERIAIKHNNYYYQLFGIFTQLTGLRELKDHDKIYELVQRAIKIKKDHKVSTAFDFLYLIQGDSYLQQGQLDSALYYFNLGEKVGLETNSKLDLSNNLIGKSKVYFEQGKYNLAKDYADRAKEVNGEEVEGLREMYWRLEAVNGNYRSAFNGAVKSFENMNENNGANDNYEIISNLLTDKFRDEKEKQQLEIEEKEKRNKLFVAQWLAGGLVFFLILTAIIQIRNREKLEKLNKSLIKRNEALTNFSYISSHDLKEPVRNIVSFSELLEESLKKSTNQTKELEFASIIKNSSNTLLEIVRSLKIFSETAFDEEIQLDVFNVESVFDDLATNMQQLITKKKADVEFVNLQGINSITFSKPMLYLLLQNLIQNALKYNETDEPEVKVDLSTSGKNYLFKIIDNGKGIDSEKLEYIFRPFKTLQSKSLSQSSGLGLSICKNILDKFNGKIWVESKVGIGSTFYFTIPKELKNA